MPLVRSAKRERCENLDVNVATLTRNVSSIIDETTMITMTYVVLQQIEHAHLRQVKTLRELLLGLTDLIV